jgi:hypothetical protein
MCERLFTGERVHITHDCTTTSNGGGICLDRRSPLAACRGDQAGRSRTKQGNADQGRSRTGEHEHEAGRLEHSGQMTD